MLFVGGGLVKKNALKVISVAMAVLLWFYVVNVGDLTPKQNTYTVNLRYINLEEGLSLILPDVVAVKLWGLAQDTDEIMAYVDVKGLKKGTYQLPVQVESVPGALFTSVEPDTVEVVIMGEKEKSFPITHAIIRNPTLGYELIDIIKTPEVCLVKGEENVVNQVNKVICEVDLSVATGITSVNVPLKALDSSGQMINKGLRLVPDKINLYLVVNQNMVVKEVPVSPVIVGKPAEGHQLTYTKTSPKVVRVIVPALMADNINGLKTGEVDITGKTESFSLEGKITVSDEVNIYPDKVIIDIGIEPDMEDDIEHGQ